ncbi:hypothetical protein [Flavobacterium sp. LB2P6]|uniref:hypothetical protein n=1 Tax=unclassified Flavobacterium TaxID=196869 RepID=UPI003AABBE43
MKLYNYLVLLLMLQSYFVVGQTGIGTKKPDESSILDIDSKTKGLLIPRLSSKERDLIKNPANALILYNTTLQAIEINIGTKQTPNWVLAGSSASGKPSVNTLTSGAILVGNVLDIPTAVHFWNEASISHSGEIIIDNTAVISKKLTGYKSGAGKITPTDNIVQAIQKLEGNQYMNAVIAVSNDYTLLITDYTILCDTEAGSFTINLPVVSSCPGKVYVINKTDETSNELIINPPIQLSKKSTVSQLNYPKIFKIQSDGKVWYVID